MATKEIKELEYAGTLTKEHKVPVQIDDGTIFQANVGDITDIAVNEVRVSHDNNFAGSGTHLSPLTLASLKTYKNNTEAVAEIGTGRLYIRSGHGLDITF